MAAMATKKALFIASAVCIAMLAADAHAVQPGRAEEWNATLVTTSRMIKSGEYAKALPILSGLMTEMLRILGPSDATTYVLAVPLIQLALAEAGTGNQKAALWHWYMAQTLYPKTAESDLSMFGDPGTYLKKNILKNPRRDDCRREHPEGYVPPKVVKNVQPVYPQGMRDFKVRGLVVIDVTIGADGIPREPRLVQPLATPVALTALEALRNWTFKPAEVKGKPIESTFCLTINFKLN
jgi:TonB family protein